MPTTAPVLFTVSEYHATFGVLSIFMIVHVLLAISYVTFERKSFQTVSKSDREGFSMTLSLPEIVGN